MKKMIYLIIIMLSFSTYIWADDYGATGALSSDKMEIESMLKYAIQDEYLALTEYETLMEEFGLTRPYSNIAESEKTHISYLEQLYERYNFDIPKIDSEHYLYIPESPLEAAQIGVQAEIQNIAMYEKFLEDDLPSDIREVFEFLKRASENHLRAFERQVTMPQGGGRFRNS